MSEPTQPGRKRKPRTGRAALIAVATTAVVAGAAALAYVVGWGIADDKQPAASPSGPSVVWQMECTSIQRAYKAWSDDAMTLATLDAMKDLDPGAVTPNLSTAGKALLGAVSNYPDQEAKELAVAVAEYNVEVGMLGLEVHATGAYKPESFKKANAARIKVNDRYNTFWAGCALSGVS
jgi:hypothetical protein